MLWRAENELRKAQVTLGAAVDALLVDSVLCKSGKTSTFNGVEGRWRRVGGMNLFLREGDGLIMNGPAALRGQPMANITSEDFRAIPHVRDIRSRKGDKATPGEDIQERSSGTNRTVLKADHGQAVVTRGFGRVSVVVSAKVSEGRHEEVERKDFPSSGGEVRAFEEAKAWARIRLRARGKNRIKPK